MNGYYRFKKGFYGRSDIPTILEEDLDRILNYQTPVSLDDIIIETTGGGQGKTPEKIFKIP